MTNVMKWFQKKAADREKDKRKAEIAQDTLERINRAIYVKRPHPTEIRSILEVHRIRIRMIDEPSGVFELKPVVVPKVTGSTLCGKSHTATLAGV